MLENIRQIGIFMIIAQTVMHFAAGKQYEKYMKIITGVIVLLLFIRPFVSDSENITAKWQDETARMMEQIEERSMAGYQMSYVTDSVQAGLLQQTEEEVKSMLNATLAGRSEQVTEVVVDMGGETGRTGAGQGLDEPVLQCVRITVRKHSDVEGDSSYTEAEITESAVGVPEAAGQDQAEDGRQGAGKTGEDLIRIDEIIVGAQVQREGRGSADGGQDVSELRHLFAETLGITEDRVEVVYLGEQ